VNDRAAELAAALRHDFHRTVRVSSPATAEITKLLENIYRCLNIALVNGLKPLCLRMGIDIWEVIEAAKTRPFGFQASYLGRVRDRRTLHSRGSVLLVVEAMEFDFQHASSSWRARLIQPCPTTVSRP